MICSIVQSLSPDFIISFFQLYYAIERIEHNENIFFVGLINTTKKGSALLQTYLLLKRGLEMLGATKAAVGVVTVDAADEDEGGTTTCAI